VTRSALGDRSRGEPSANPPALSLRRLFAGLRARLSRACAAALRPARPSPRNGDLAATCGPLVGEAWVMRSRSRWDATQDWRAVRGRRRIGEEGFKISAVLRTDPVARDSSRVLPSFWFSADEKNHARRACPHRGAARHIGSVRLGWCLGCLTWSQRLDCGRARRAGAQTPFPRSFTHCLAKGDRLHLGWSADKKRRVAATIGITASVTLPTHGRSAL